MKGESLLGLQEEARRAGECPREDNYSVRGTHQKVTGFVV